MTDSFHWLDIDRIAEELFDRHPDEDPISMPFPRLMTLVRDLDGFEEAPGHPCNERILEAIQQAWIDEHED
jgi:FeS assembly protein IscX